MRARNSNDIPFCACQSRRRRLIAEAIHRHGVSGIKALLELIEIDIGADLRVDARLEHLIDAAPAALALFDRVIP
jgi:hypothetical protein